MEDIESIEVLSPVRSEADIQDERDANRRVEAVLRRRRILKLLEEYDEVLEDSGKVELVRPDIFFLGGHCPHDRVRKAIKDGLADLIKQSHALCIQDINAELALLGVTLFTPPVADDFPWLFLKAGVRSDVGSGSLFCQPITTTTMQNDQDTLAFLRATVALKQHGKEDAIHTLVQDYLGTTELSLSPVAALAIGREAGWCPRYDAALALAIGQPVTADFFNDARGKIEFRLTWTWDGYEYVPSVYRTDQWALALGRTFRR